MAIHVFCSWVINNAGMRTLAAADKDGCAISKPMVSVRAVELTPDQQTAMQPAAQHTAMLEKPFGEATMVET